MTNTLKYQLYLRSRDKIYIFLVIGASALLTVSIIVGNTSVASLSNHTFSELSGMFETSISSYDDFIQSYSPILFVKAMSNQSMLPWICSVLTAYFIAYDIEFRRINIPVFNGNSRSNVLGAYLCLYQISITLMTIVSYVIALAYLGIRWNAIPADMIIRIFLLRLLLNLSIGILYTIFAFALKKAIPTLALSIVFTYVMSNAPASEGSLLYYYPTNIQMDQRFWLLTGSSVLSGVAFSLFVFFASIIISTALFNRTDLR